MALASVPIVSRTAAQVGENVQNAPSSERVETARGEFSRLDAAIAVLLAAATVGVFLLIVAAFGDSLARLGITGQYLESDGYRVVGDMLDPAGVHARLAVHPLYSLFVIPFARIFLALGASRLQAVWICNAAMAAAAVASLYAIQRLLGSSRRAAALVCTLSLSSSAMLFWMTVPETYLLGALSMLACFGATALRGPFSDVGMLAAGVFSLGVTVTNWSVGIILAALYRPLGKAMVIVLATAVVAAAGWRVEKILFAQMPGIILKAAVFSNETEFMVSPRGALAGELIHPVVAPLGEVVEGEHGFRMFSFQGASIPRRGAPAVLAAVGWLIVLAAGLAALVRGPAPARFRLMLGLVLATQIVLHLVYGEETFLYALHFWVLLMLLAGLAVQADRRGVVSGVVAATILFASWNNVRRLSEAAELPLYEGTCRLNVLNRPLEIDEYRFLHWRRMQAEAGGTVREGVASSSRTRLESPKAKASTQPTVAAFPADGPDGSQDRR